MSHGLQRVELRRGRLALHPWQWKLWCERKVVIAYVLAVNHHGWRLLAGAKRGRLTFLAAVSSRLSTKQLGGLLAASGA